MERPFTVLFQPAAVRLFTPRDGAEKATFGLVVAGSLRSSVYNHSVSQLRAFRCKKNRPDSVHVA